MRIAQVMLAKKFGGAERSFVDLSRQLVAAGHDVLAIAERRAAALPSLERIDGLTLATVTVHGPWDWWAGRRLERILARFAPAVVQAHLARAAALAGGAARRLGIPALAKTHNYVNPKYYRHLTHVVPTTESQFRYLLDQDFPRDRLTVIPNFSEFAAVSSAVTPAPPLHAVAAGRMVPKKGFDVLLEAIAAVVADGVDIHLSVAGDGPQRQPLERAAQRSGIAERIHLAGWVDDVASFLRRGNLFVLPSLDEPFGIVVLEAMALGLPIVATATAGPTEVLDEDSALLVAPGDVAALTAALRAVSSDPAAAAGRAECALTRYREAYSAAAVVPQYVALYERLVAATGVLQR